MATTTLTQLPPEVRTYFDRLLLTLARPYFIYDLFAQKRQVPLNSGDMMVFRRYGTLTAASVPLTDGQTPPGDQLSVTDFSTQIQWYGSFVTISDQVQYVVQDRVLNEATKVLSLQLGLTIDTLVRDMMVSTASTIAASNGLNGNTPTEITDADVQLAVIALRQGNARLMTNPLPGENKFGTSPVRSSYWGFMSVDLQADLEAISTFISAANYPNPMNALEAEWGTTRNVRWLLNTNAFSNGASPNVYSSFIMGQEAYGVVRLGAKEAEFIVKPLGASGTADPLNQRGTVNESAVGKFSLIDLELLSNEDDRAQADEPQWLLAA